jgi:hypothetical protein
MGGGVAADASNEFRLVARSTDVWHFNLGGGDGVNASDVQLTITAPTTNHPSAAVSLTGGLLFANLSLAIALELPVQHVGPDNDPSASSSYTAVATLNAPVRCAFRQK